MALWGRPTAQKDRGGRLTVTTGKYTGRQSERPGHGGVAMIFRLYSLASPGPQQAAGQGFDAAIDMVRAAGETGEVSPA